MHRSWGLMGLAWLGAAACTAGGAAPPGQAAAPAEQAANAPLVAAQERAPETVAGLTRIADANQVCMVNNQFMGRDQIPVEFEGRIYYGCCAGCVTRIQTDPTVRAAVDPVTGQEVDKATAVMAQDSEGNVQYFESDESFARYRGQG